MEVGSPEWIEASLAKLDMLERQRSEHEAALESATDPATLKHHNDAFERLDAEIKSLYAQLEAVAGEEEEQEEEGDEEAVVAPHVTQADEELSAPHRAASKELAAPVAAPMAASAESPFASSGGGYEAPAAAVSFDDDVPKGGGAKWAFVGLIVVAGLGVGGYFAWQNMQAQKQKDEQAKPTQVEEVKIDAAQIRDDTEAPNAAKGGDATISPTANGYTSGSGGTGGGSGGSGKKVDEKKKKPLELKGGSDPLTGGDPLG